MLNRILDIVYSTIIKILRAEVPDDEETAEEVFSVIYSAIGTQLSWSNKEAAETVFEK